METRRTKHLVRQSNDPATRWPIDTADESLAGRIGDGGRGALAGVRSRNDKFGEDPPTPGSDGDSFVSIGDAAERAVSNIISRAVHAARIERVLERWHLSADRRAAAIGDDDEGDHRQQRPGE
jgi:hypothetical protein